MVSSVERGEVARQVRVLVHTQVGHATPRLRFIVRSRPSESDGQGSICRGSIGRHGPLTARKTIAGIRAASASAPSSPPVTGKLFGIDVDATRRPYLARSSVPRAVHGVAVPHAGARPRRTGTRIGRCRSMPPTRSPHRRRPRVPAVRAAVPAAAIAGSPPSWARCGWPVDRRRSVDGALGVAATVRAPCVDAMISARIDTASPRGAGAEVEADGPSPSAASVTPARAARLRSSVVRRDPIAPR